MRKTHSTKPLSDKQIVRSWHLVNIEGKILGRETNKISQLLQGKHKVTYVPQLDTGDYVVVINAGKVKVTGRKMDDKKYSFYSGYPSGLRTVTLKMMMKQKPAEVIRHAVSGQLPKNKLRDVRLKRLFVYEADAHPHQDKFAK
jgi:large subunit ribosomal protein L13